MKRNFLANLAFLIFANLLVKPFWIFGIDRTVQNTLGAEAYGTYFSVFNFSLLLYILLDLGINNYNNRKVAQATSFASANIFSIISLKSVLAVLYLVLTLSVGYLIGFNDQQIWLLAFLSLGQILLSFLLYFRSNISGMHFFKLDGMLSVTDRLLMILICSALLFTAIRSSFTIEWFVYAQTTSLLLAAIIGGIVVARKVPSIRFQTQTTQLKGLLSETYPYAILGILMTVYYRIDGVMIERMLPAGEGAQQAGIYAASYRLLDAANMIGFLFASIMMPMFARMLAQKENISELLYAGLKTLLSSAIILVVICYFGRDAIMTLLYHDANETWSQLFGWLMLAYPGVCLVYIYGSLLTANGSLKQLNLIAFSGMVLNIMLNYILIQEMKALGATIATVITQTIVALLHIIVANKVLRLPMVWWSLAKFLIFCALTVVAGFFLTELTSNNLINLILIGLSGLIFTIITGLVSLSDIRNLIETIKHKEEV